ncbi:atlastin-like [Chironomus tepperi]|uniref:atlastin-like n=1 Tax=Chironomus tepperi TaxID=113505 RepID=UPI00391F50A8
MSFDHPYGTPVPVMKFSDTGEVIVHSENLEKVFSHPEIQDHKIVILSIVGATRGGKSYFLDYCLRFLYAHYPSINDPKIDDGEFLFVKDKNWMGSRDEPLRGFSWRSGTKRDTAGIIIWSDVFLHTDEETDEKIAIYVMDTQGLFDNSSTPADNSRIFVLSNLISSIEVLNLANKIQEDQLQYLQFATELTQFTAIDNKESNEKLFQNLLFLIRDWYYFDDYNFGTAGGEEYLKKVISSISTQKPELQSVRDYITSSFDQIDCCLLPFPGRIVAGNRNYDGRWSEMDEEFKDELKKLIECLLLPENLVIKKISSMEVTVKEMKQYIQDYFKLFQTNHIPKVSSVYDLTVDSFMNSLIDKYFDDYKLTFFRNKDIITEENILTVHEKCKERSLELYDSEKKMGNSEHAANFKTKLEQEIEKYFIIFKDRTEKNLQKIKEERMKYEAMLTAERQLKEQAEETKAQTEKQLFELENAHQQNCIELNDYKSQKALLEARLNKKRRKLQKVEEKLQREERFRWIMLGLLGLTIAVTGGAVAIAIESAQLAGGAAAAVGTAITAGSTGMGMTGSNTEPEVSNDTALSTEVANTKADPEAEKKNFTQKVNTAVEASEGAMKFVKNVTNIAETAVPCILKLIKEFKSQ